MADRDVALAQEFADELLNIFARHPGAAEACVDFGRGQVGGLHGLQGFDVALELRVGQHGGFRCQQLGPDIAGEIVVLGFPAIGLGIEKDGSLEFGQEIRHGPVQQLADVVHIDPATFVQADQQRVLRRIDRLGRTLLLHRALAEDGGLRRTLRLGLVMLQRQQQGQIGIAAKCSGVGAFGDGAELPDKIVVGLVELLARDDDLGFGRFLQLHPQTAAHRVTHADEPAQAGRGGRGQIVQHAHHITIPPRNLAVDQRVGMGLYLLRGRDARLLVDGDDVGSFRSENIFRQARDGLRQLLRQVASVADQRRFAPSIHAAGHLHLAQQHLGMRGEVFVHGDRFLQRVGNLNESFPRRNARQLAGQPLAQHHEIRGDFRVRVSFEGVVRQADGSKQIRVLTHVSPQGVVHLVERALGGDEEDEAARSDLRQGRGEEVIVDDEVPLLEAKVVGFVIAERNISDRYVVVAIHESGFFKWLMPEIGVGVEQF